MAQDEEKAVVPFDANQAMQAIKDKIKSAFVELIPDAQWQEMVKKEVDDFFKEKPVNTGYGNNTVYRSNFQDLVREQLKATTKEKVEKYLADNYTAIWDMEKGGYKANAVIEGMISANAGAILVDMLTNVIGQRLSANRF